MDTSKPIPETAPPKQRKEKIKRSRNGCHKCKKLKIKCDEKKPSCSYCVKTGASCDYTVKLTWGGRPFKNAEKRAGHVWDVSSEEKKRKVKEEGSGGVAPGFSIFQAAATTPSVAAATPPAGHDFQQQQAPSPNLSFVASSFNVIESGTTGPASKKKKASPLSGPGSDKSASAAVAVAAASSTPASLTSNAFSPPMPPSSRTSNVRHGTGNSVPLRKTQSDSYRITSKEIVKALCNSERPAANSEQQFYGKTASSQGNSPQAGSLLSFNRRTDGQLSSPLINHNHNPMAATGLSSMASMNSPSVNSNNLHASSQRHSGTLSYNSSHLPDTTSKTGSVISSISPNHLPQSPEKPSLVDYFPGISDGIESLSHALESIASGGNSFNIKNSEIFNNFVMSNMEDKNDDNSLNQNNFVGSPYNFPVNKTNHTNQINSLNGNGNGVSQGSDRIDDGSGNGPQNGNTAQTGASSGSNVWDFSGLENYSADLAKIEQIMPQNKSNFMEDFLSPSLSSAFTRRHIQPTTSSSSTAYDQQPDSDSRRSSSKGRSPNGELNGHYNRQIDEEELDPMAAFETIPPSITPLPEILLQVPYYRGLFHFWLNVASDHLVPAPSKLYHENPFKVILPRMAMESPSILTTLLAFAETVRGQYEFAQNESRVIIDQLLARACSELLKLLQDKTKATSDATLATVLLLSCLEVFRCGNFERHRAHTLGARQIILSRGLKLPTSSRFQELDDKSEQSNNDSQYQLALESYSTPTITVSKDNNNNNNIGNVDKESTTTQENNYGGGSLSTTPVEAKDAKNESSSDFNYSLSQEGITPKSTGTREENLSPASNHTTATNTSASSIDYDDEEDSTSSESDVTYFLMRWFAYVDVIGALSATKKADNYLSLKSEEDLYHDTGQLQVEKSGHIDRLLGFDVVFLPLLADIALLIRQTNNYLSTPGSSTEHMPINITSRAMEIKESMSRTFANGELKRKKRLEKIIRNRNLAKAKAEGPDTSPANVTNILLNDDVLRCTNKIFFNMGLLNLYRRVFRVPKKSILVQELCQEIGDILQLNIEPKSPAEICSIFCTFCAACDTTNITMQQLFHARFTVLAEMGMTNAKRCLEIMERCWQTGAEWVIAAQELGIDFTLL